MLALCILTSYIWNEQMCFFRPNITNLISTYTDNKKKKLMKNMLVNPAIGHIFISYLRKKMGDNKYKNIITFAMETQIFKQWIIKTAVLLNCQLYKVNFYGVNSWKGNLAVHIWVCVERQKIVKDHRDQNEQLRSMNAVKQLL